MAYAHHEGVVWHSTYLRQRQHAGEDTRGRETVHERKVRLQLRAREHGARRARQRLGLSQLGLSQLCRSVLCCAWGSACARVRTWRALNMRYEHVFAIYYSHLHL